MTRLEELHKAYEDMQEQYVPEWTHAYDILPHSSRIVNVQIWKGYEGIKSFGVPARCIDYYGVKTWFTPDYKFLEGWVTFWKDF